jgi:hypothetical protein
MPDECPHSDDDAAAVLHVTQSLEDDPSAASVESVASPSDDNKPFIPSCILTMSLMVMILHSRLSVFSTWTVWLKNLILIF